jgi:hypothetical protein
MEGNKQNTTQKDTAVQNYPQSRFHCRQYLQIPSTKLIGQLGSYIHMLTNGLCAYGV